MQLDGIWLHAPSIPAESGGTGDAHLGGLSGCTPITAHALDGAFGVTVAPGGRNLYAAAEQGNVLTHFKITRTGDLIFAGCIGDHRGCTRTRPRHALDGALGVALTTAGPPQAYVASETANVVSRFRIDAAGNLIFAGCTGGLAGCTRITPHAFDGAAGLAVTGGRAHLYAAAAPAVSHFKIRRF